MGIQCDSALDETDVGERNPSSAQRLKRVYMRQTTAAQLILVPSSSSSVRRESDPRHAPTRERIQQLHRERFDGLECQWDGSEGCALNRLLAANKSWTQAQLDSMVTNVFRSSKYPGRPRIWLSNLTHWAAGPRDDFNRTITKQTEGWAGTRQAANNRTGGLSRAERATIDYKAVRRELDKINEALAGGHRDYEKELTEALHLAGVTRSRWKEIMAEFDN